MDLEVRESVRKYNQPGLYTYADYSNWDNDKRYELIDGEVFMMSAPSVEHQNICGELFRQLANFLIGKQCKVFISPFDVCLSGKGDIDDTVVQPDIVVICDHTMLDEKRCNGAPDMIIEVLSPSTSRHDRIEKLNKYLQTGVQEYWIVDPVDKSVAVHIIENSKYVINAYTSDAVIPVEVLNDCKISLQYVF